MEGSILIGSVSWDEPVWELYVSSEPPWFVLLHPVRTAAAHTSDNNSAFFILSTFRHLRLTAME